MTLAIVLLVAGLIVGGGIGYFAAPTKQGASTTVTVTVPGSTIKQTPLAGTTIQLGSIAASDTNLETEKPWHEQTITTDMNAYAKLLGYDVTYQWLVDNAGSQDATHLEKVQGYRSMGVTCFQGGGWSSQAQASLSYINSNHQLMWSYSSTSPTLSIAGDRLYRACPSDAALAPALVDVMWNYGIKSVIVFQRGDSWGDGIVNLFVPAWTAKGGVIAGDKVRYDTAATDFSNYLQVANTEASAAITSTGSAAKVGILLLSFDEGPVIISQAKDYASFYECIPFGGDGTAVSIRIMDDAPQQAIHMKIFSLMASSPVSVKFNTLKAEYEKLTNQQFTAYTGYQYDIGFIFMGTQLQAASAQADDIVNLQTAFCYNMYGSTGWVQLNQYGDRAPPPFDIWYYAAATPANPRPSGCASFIAGSYDNDLKTTTWNLALPGVTPGTP
jgi:branched-chain amino acid transport system substrate-binding protein